MADQSSAPTAEKGTIEIGDTSRLPERPLVSVCMLTYNQERYIARAIEGVISQRRDFPVELIIGEDHSDDGTPRIVNDHQKRRPDLIRIITSDGNVGGFCNSGRCLSRCKGKYIAFCEGDDYWTHPEKLKLQLEIMAASPDVSLCHSDYDRKIGFRTKRNCHRRRRTPHLAIGEAYMDLLHAWTVMTATAMYRRDVIKDFLLTEFNNASWPFGDYNKALYASVRGRVAYLPVSTATWRKLPGSATNAGYDRFLKMAVGYAQCRESFMRRYPVSPDVEKSVRRESNERIMKRAFYAGETDLFECCVRWLSNNGFEPGAFNRKRARLVMNSPALLSFVREARMLVQGLGMLGG